MGGFRSFVRPLIALMLSACEPTTQLPLRHDVVTLNIGGPTLVCHVRNIAAAQDLSFHYGTYPEGAETRTTFRLIGEGYEIVVVNPRRLTYDLSVYDMSRDGSSRSRAESSYATFKRALLGQPSPDCDDAQ